jgi:hypothetical protein
MKKQSYLVSEAVVCCVLQGRGYNTLENCKANLNYKVTG